MMSTGYGYHHTVSLQAVYYYKGICLMRMENYQEVMMTWRVSVQAVDCFEAANSIRRRSCVFPYLYQACEALSDVNKASRILQEGLEYVAMTTVMTTGTPLMMHNYWHCPLSVY